MSAGPNTRGGAKIRGDPRYLGYDLVAFVELDDETPVVEAAAFRVIRFLGRSRRRQTVDHAGACPAAPVQSRALPALERLRELGIIEDRDGAIVCVPAVEAWTVLESRGRLADSNETVNGQQSDSNDPQSIENKGGALVRDGRVLSGDVVTPVGNGNSDKDSGRGAAELTK